jgi:phospholipase C
MDGFIGQAESGRRGCLNATDPACTNSSKPDVLGYHTAGDIPNYWAYAKNFVLQDHLFEPNASWSLPEHLFQVSEWSAACTRHNQPVELCERPPVAGHSTRRSPRLRRRGS